MKHCHKFPARACAFVVVVLAATAPLGAQFLPVTPPDSRGRVDAEREGTMDAANIRTSFYNFGMVGDYPADPGNVDLSVFHSVEVPKGSGMNYSDGITPFVLAKIVQRNGLQDYIMETGYRERQGISPYFNRVMRFEPRPGFFQANPAINVGRSPALSNDPRTWPDAWPDKDASWDGWWNGYFGKRPAADQESFTVMDDNFYDAWDYYPDFRDTTRRGLGLRVEVRGFQWANPQAGNVIFWHYDITNESTTDYNDNIIFGLYMDSGVGGSALSCDGVYESDDDNAYFDRSFGLNLVYTWDKLGHGKDLTSNCGVTGYLGYAYLETPGNSTNGIDDDLDGMIDERRDSGPGVRIDGQQAIRDYWTAHYNLVNFQAYYGKLEKRPAYIAGHWWTGDEDGDWVAEFCDTGADGVFGTGDAGEYDGIPTSGEPNFDRTDIHESDQIGLTGFKMNRIKQGVGNPNPEVDNVVFFNDGKNWPKRLFDKFSDPNPPARFDSSVFLNYNIAFLFASGPFILPAAKTERFSLALAYGADLNELRGTTKTVQQIYNANYQFAVPPPLPTLRAETGEGWVRLSWDDVAEHGVDPVTSVNDFEGYRIYRATDAEFQDPRVITTGRGTGPLGNGKPIAQFDLIDGIAGYSKQVAEGVAYYLGNESGVTHTFTDTTAVNGMEYYYAVCSYDYGNDSLGFYPSENSIAVSRTPRGGVILPTNVVRVRPNPKAPGFTPAAADTARHASGRGSGTVGVRIVKSDIVPNDHLFTITFNAFSADSIRAISYNMYDSTLGKMALRFGTDLAGAGTGPVGSGLLPVISTPLTVSVDAQASGFDAGSSTNTRLQAAYQYVLPINLRRPGYPEDLTVRFSSVAIDTSVAGIGTPSTPSRFRVIANTDSGDIRLRFRFRDNDLDGTLSRADDYIDVITYTRAAPGVPQVTWRIQLDTAGQWLRGAIVAPTDGDVYRMRIIRPFGASDVFAFTSHAQRIDEARAREEFKTEPYVVPNPYVGSASFEPARFAVSGRGDRRIEFRGLPQSCTVRIFTVKGELVQTLRHDGSTEGYVPWDLRTKDNLDVAPGLYIFHVDAPGVGKFIGKFAIIK